MSLHLDAPALYLITEGGLTADNFDAAKASVLEAVSAAVGLNVQLIQVREKRLDGRRLFNLVKEAAAITRGSKTRLLLNDRADISEAAGAAGVHLTSASIPTDVIKRSFPKLIIGVSTHAADEVERAREAGADFALFGPVFETPGKGKAEGINSLRHVCEGVARFPVLAVGGIGETNFRDVIRAGAAGFAAIRSLNDPASLRAIAASMNK